MSTVEQPPSTIPPRVVGSPARAAGLYPTFTLPEPLAIALGTGAAQAHGVPWVAAGW